MFENEFYPTPEKLADKLLKGIRFLEIKAVLEPSAGKGDLIKAFTKGYLWNRDRQVYTPPYVKIDCCEIDKNLVAILKENKDISQIIEDDFLRFETYYKYDLILMNPPFSNGDKHLLKALKMQEYGGKIRCILNAETVRNPYTNSRKELVQLLEKYDANIEYVENAFSNAEFKTDVEVALISVDIPNNEYYNSCILENLEKAKEEKQKNELGTAETHLDNRSYLDIAIDRYKEECAMTAKVINEIYKLSPMITSDFSKDGEPCGNVISIDVHTNVSKYKDLSKTNQAMCMIRRKYWKTLFQTGEISKKLTCKMRDEYLSKIDDLGFYEFNLSNIKQVQIDIVRNLSASVEDTILKLFEDFSYNGYWDEMSKNIHYYNGWKTNKAYIVNKKVIQRLNAYDYIFKKIYVYPVCDVALRLADIEKVFEYLNPNKETYQTVSEIIRDNQDCNKYSFHYFDVIFYKKGTCHITFKDDDLLKKFNLFGSQKKGWLFHEYGKKQYKDMTAEEKSVVDEFEGEKSYKETIKNAEYYLNTNVSDSLLMLEG